MKKLLLLISILFMGVSTVFAANTDISNIELKVEGINDTQLIDAYIRIYNATWNDESTIYALISKDTSNIPETFTTTTIPENAYEIQDIKDENETVIKKAQIMNIHYLPKAEKYGDVYVTFYEKLKDQNEVKKLGNPILVKQPEHLPLSKRIVIYPFHDYTSFFVWDLNFISTERKVNYKIGKVTDTNIIRKIIKGDYSGLQDLMTLAKSDANPIVTGTKNATTNVVPLFAQTDLKEKQFYYIYAVLDDENGTYIPLEDVSLYQALNSNGNLWLIDYTDNNIYFEDSPTTVVNPKTGVETYIIEGLLVIAGAIVLIKLASRKEAFRKI